MENRFELETPQTLKITNLPSISINDCFATKLLANADRWNDSSTNARYLIDLAMLRRQSAIPDVAIVKAEAACQVQQPLIEVHKKVSSQC